MNKHDFYKELMSEYSFDAEKIKANAKKGRFARQKIAPLAIGLTAAVAAVTVAVGSLAMTTLGNNNGVSLVDNSSTLSAKSDTERLKDAMAQLEKDKESAELRDVMVTFAYTLSPAETQAVLTKYTNGSVPIKALYLADGTRIIGEANIGAAFSKNDAEIIGVAINCSGAIKASLANDTTVYLAEDMSEMDFESALPVDVDSLVNNSDNTTIDIPDVPIEPTPTPEPAPKPADTTVSTPTNLQPIVPDEPTDPVVDPELPDIIDIPDDDEDVVPAPEDTPATSTSVSEPEQTTLPDTSDSSQEPEPQDPVELSAAVMPEDIKLPIEFAAMRYETIINDAESAFFIDDYIMFVKKSDGFGLYSFSLGNTEEIVVQNSNETKMHWISATGENLLISGKSAADSNRSKLWFVNSATGTIVDLGAEDSVMDGTLVDVGYNEDSNLLVMNIIENGTSYITAYNMDENGKTQYIGDVFESSAKLTLMCANGGIVYIAASDGSLTQIISCDVYTGNTKIIGSYDNNPSITKNYAFTHAVISPSGNALTGVIEVFDPTTENFVRTDYFGETISFGASRHSFAINNRYYTVSNGVIIPTEKVSAIAQVEFRKSLSAVYAVSNVAKERITILGSAYTKANLAENLIFNIPAESYTGSQLEAFRGALGVNNALALSQCKEAGLTKPDKLISAIEGYYSNEASQALINRCNISAMGTLSYTSGNLTAASADDCMLVITEQGTTYANGSVYVAVGSIGGKTAYRSINVSFIAEDGLWKLDSIL